MNAENESNEVSLFESLKAKYPLLFSENEQEPINHFQIECRSGWDHIIESLCHLLYLNISSKKRELDYWSQKLSSFESGDKFYKEENLRERISKCNESYEEACKNVPKICQIKEKFGTIRIYVDNLDDYTSGVIDFAEQMSANTCEFCGDKGSTYAIRWHKTLCPKHAKEFYHNVPEETLKKAIQV